MTPRTASPRRLAEEVRPCQASCQIGAFYVIRRCSVALLTGVDPAPGERMASDSKPVPENPRQYVCPSCRLHLLSWTTHTNTVEMFHKVAPWTDFWTGDVRLVCQYCLGATELIPTQLVDLLRQRFGFSIPQSSPTPPGPRRD